jgi:hypothetical protein
MVGQHGDLPRVDRVIVYQKGALVLHELREPIGDTAFWSGIRGYTLANFGKTVSTAGEETIRPWLKRTHYFRYCLRQGDTADKRDAVLEGWRHAASLSRRSRSTTTTTCTTSNSSTLRRKVAPSTFVTRELAFRAGLCIALGAFAPSDLARIPLSLPIQSHCFPGNLCGIVERRLLAAT